MSSIFKDSDELMAAFKIPELIKYVDPKGYKDRIGFSIQREYPEKSKYRPPVTKDGKPDTRALIGVRYDPERVSNKKPNLVPLVLSTNVFSNYLSKNNDYIFSDRDCPTEASIILSKKTPRPIDLISKDEVFYDHDDDTFTDKTGKELTDKKGNSLKGVDILDDLFNQHIATVDRIKGRVFQLRIRSSNIITRLVELLEKSFKSLMRILCGRTYEPDDPWRGALEPYELSDLKLLSTERINVFGYKASKNIIVTFCILLLGGYLVVRLIITIPSWAKTIASNGLLSIAFAICLISALDHFMPKIIFSIVNQLIKVRVRRYTKPIKF